MHVIAFRHVPFEHLGLIATVLAERGIACRYADIFDQALGPQAWESAAALIFMGGPMSVNDSLPFIRQELRLIERAVMGGKPVLGVCLGAQLIARALGARVYRNPVKEIGWALVWWREAARSDPLFQGLSEPEVLFHWHGETFDLPAGAAWLASSDACPHQAFRAASAYGLQFHLEVTPEMIADWCAQDANSGDVRELAAPIDPGANATRLAELAGLVFGRWADLVAPGNRSRPAGRAFAD
jgi:GMP synthase (glutamine-hydrolysing)